MPAVSAAGNNLGICPGSLSRFSFAEIRSDEMNTEQDGATASSSFVFTSVTFYSSFDFIFIGVFSFFTVAEPAPENSGKR